MPPSISRERPAPPSAAMSAEPCAERPARSEDASDAGDFYEDTLRRLLRDGAIQREMRVVVLCGAERDRDALLACGFRSVTITNLDTRGRPESYSPFEWSFQDAENLTFADDAFDLAVVHSGLHHCRSPHRALLEMYRVARRGILVFEPRDNALVRLGIRLNVGQEYEVAAVFAHDLEFGGLNNSAIPNYVYRFTEREVRKTISSFAPVGTHRYRFFYATRIPWGRLALLRNPVYRLGMALALPALRALTFVFPRLSNNFAAFVTKPDFPRDLFPWLTMQGGQVAINQAWLDTRYAKSESAAAYGDSKRR
jgi:SAM-dependent methyltransferase